MIISSHLGRINSVTTTQAKQVLHNLPTPIKSVAVIKVGYRSGRLTVVDISKGSRKIKCECSCGTICYRAAYRLRHQETVSCGCAGSGPNKGGNDRGKGTKQIEQWSADGETFIMTYDSMTLASKAVGCSQSSISLATDDDRRKAMGFTWKTPGSRNAKENYGRNRLLNGWGYPLGFV